MAKSIESYGVKQQNGGRDGLDTNVEQITLLGYSVIENVITSDLLDRVAGLIDFHLEEQAKQNGGIEAMTKRGDTGTLRACISLNDIFLEIATNPVVMFVAQRLLGDYFTLMLQNALVLSPRVKHQQAAFHRDLPYQHFVSSRPLALNALLCVDDFTVESGCTYVIPASHKEEAFPSDATVNALMRPLTAPAGSFLLFDAMLFHRSGYNVGSRVRRGINTCYCLPFIKQQISLPRLIGAGKNFSPEVSRLLGYGCETPGNLQEWYEERDRRWP
jgi:ectoine hydroxylase-related dioxygenase (phytanoyl-CoA dioxygenase family)